MIMETISNQCDAVGKLHACEVCGFKFSFKSELKKHELIHTNKKPHSCHLCDKAFLKKANLKAHIFLHSNQKPYTCDVCGKTYAVKRGLKSHMALHTKEKPHVCLLCDKAFPFAAQLRVHLRTHTNETPYECEVCNKGYTKQSSLKSHLLTHSGEKPHECKVCKRKFTRKFSLGEHLRQHTGEEVKKYYKEYSDISNFLLKQEKKFACQDCGKTFSKRHHCLRHERIHIKEKSSSSKTINEVYSEEYFKSRSDEKPHVCELCNEVFTQKKSLARHLQSHIMNKTSLLPK